MSGKAIRLARLFAGKKNLWQALKDVVCHGSTPERALRKHHLHRPAGQ